MERRLQEVGGLHCRPYTDTANLRFRVVIEVLGHDPDGDTPVLAFTKSENQYRLSTIWGTATEGRSISKQPIRAGGRERRGWRTDRLPLCGQSLTKKNSRRFRRPFSYLRERLIDCSR
jgi:hypothetical protein